MVRAPFRLSFGGPSLVNAIAFCAGGGQLERISPPVVSSRCDRRSRLCFYLPDEPCFEKLRDGPLGLGALWTFRRDQTMIIALRRSAEQHKLRVVEFDGHV